jgi:hypothetical protein
MQKESDLEYATHVQSQLAFEKESLLKMKLSVPDMGKDLEQTSEEKINVLEELLTPLRNSVLVSAENIYTPTTIGVLSRYPWYDFLKDWLCLLQNDITVAEFDMFPFER